MAYKVGDIVWINDCPSDISEEQWNQEIKGQHFSIYRKTFCSSNGGYNRWRLEYLSDPKKKVQWCDNQKIIDWVDSWF